MFNHQSYPFYKQSDKMDCGPTCLKMLTRFYGKRLSLSYLRKLCEVNIQGVSATAIAHAAEKLGFKTLVAELPYTTLLQKAPTPCILHWDKNHFVVLWKVNPKHIYIGDPALNKNVRYSYESFLDHWLTDPGNTTGRAIFLETRPEFDQVNDNEAPSVTLFSLFRHIKAQRFTAIRIFATLIIASLLTLAIPLLTQAIVDTGIQAKNVRLLTAICLGQLLLFSGRLASDFIRSRLLFKLGMHISMDILSSFLAKLMRLRVSFFDRRHSGDNLQRIYDNQRIEDFLTKYSVSAILSAVSLLVYGALLCYYNWQIFLFFIVISLIGIAWSNSFEEKRYKLDQRTFHLLAANQRLQIEIFEAMQEIKLTGSEQEKNNNWKKLQLETYEVKLKSLKMDQFVQGVALFINESKNILTTYFAALMVIQDELSLGGMLAITYIYGALNGPINQLSDFVRAGQTTRFSLQRLDEVQQEEDEDFNSAEQLISSEEKSGDIFIDSVHFKYGSSSPDVLKNVSLHIPSGKITAIVGMSGSGKTTLLKLLLKFYPLIQGEITVAGKNLATLNAHQWRKQCGVVLQDSFIFSDTIAGNIWVGAPEKDLNKVKQACEMAKLATFIESLPFGYDTPIGHDGVGLSEGQKQRLLIARLIYRQPAYIFLDEATNSLDANNEKMIIENLNHFFRGKTVIIVAHRLSTVRHADQIVVLQDGVIAEQGSHEELTLTKGIYFELVRNQLELGK